MSNSNNITGEEILKAWRKNNIIAFAQRSFHAFFSAISIFFILALVYLLLSEIIDFLPKIINFNGIFKDKSNTEILNYFNDKVILYVTIAVGGIAFLSLLKQAIDIIATFDLARWIENREIDYRTVVLNDYDNIASPEIRKEMGITFSELAVFDVQIYQSGLIIASKTTKKYYYISLLVNFIIDILFIIGLYLFLGLISNNMYLCLELQTINIKEMLFATFINYKFFILMGSLIFRQIFNSKLNGKINLEAQINIENESGYYTIKLLDAGENKLEVIKIIKEYTGLSLVDIKSIVDSSGIILERASLGVTEKITEELEDVGANVEVY